MAKTTFDPADIRNIVLVGHGASGKTALGEAMLFNTGATTRLGETTAGTSTFDFEPEEHKRGGSIASAFAWTTHNNNKINIIDTPGDGNFIYDAFAAMRGADAAFVVISAPDGVEVQTERVYREAEQLGLARVVVLNKMDRERADPEAALNDFEESFGVRAVPLQVPIGVESSFRGVVSLLQRKALVYATDGSGKYEKTDVPAELEGAVESAWETLVEAVASTDDELLEKYLETFELSEEEVRLALRSAICRGELVPAVYTSAAANVGVQAVLDVISWACPSPLERAPMPAVDAHGEPMQQPVDPDGPFSALVVHSFIDEFSGKQSIFRVVTGTGPEDGIVVNRRNGEQERLGSLYSLRGTQRDAVDRAVTGDILAVAKLRDTRTNDTLCSEDFVGAYARLEYPEPMMRFTVQVAHKGDEDKLKTAMEKLLDEDPTLQTGYDTLSRQMLLAGMGQQHLEMAVEKLGRKFKVAVETALPLVPYRETLRRRVEGVEGKHKKQSGGAGQFGVCYLNVEPLPRGEGFEFVDKIVGGAIPRQYIPSVEKGILGRMEKGPRAGYPITDIRVELIDGKYHAVDSKDIAYQAAGSKGIRAALQEGGIKLLEPVYRMEIRVPNENMGDIMGDITARRGRVLGMEPDGKKWTTIRTVTPLAEIQRYAPDLRSMTGGQGTFTMEFEGYEDLPAHLEDKIVRESPFGGEEEEE